VLESNEEKCHQRKVAGLLVEQEKPEGAEVSGNANYEKNLSRNESDVLEFGSLTTSATGFETGSKNEQSISMA
jgi:hypothetical protein